MGTEMNMRTGNEVIEVTFDKFDKSKSKATYDLLSVRQMDNFRVVAFQVALPQEERKLQTQRMLKQAFLKQ